jgi:homoserine kinase
VSIGVRVPASTSNLGAGFDCLGLALDLWLEARLVEGPGKPVYRGTLSGLRADQDITLRLVRAAGLGSDWGLEVDSAIPIGKGLGSSGAAVVAGLALAQLARGERLDHARLLALATAEEGHPDNVGPAIYGGLFLAGRPGGWLTLHNSLAPALGVPEMGMDTHRARSLLPREVPREAAVAQAAGAASLVLGLIEGDPELIARGMEDHLAVPHRKGLIAGFDAAVAAGREAGAYGVTISGAGSALLGIGPTGAAPEIARAIAEALTRAGNPATPLTPGVAERGCIVTMGG